MASFKLKFRPSVTQGQEGTFVFPSDSSQGGENDLYRFPYTTGRME